MARFIKDRSASKGQRPGSLILIGNQKMEKPEIHLMDIESENLVERELKSIEEAIPCRDSSPVSWINIWGIHDTEMIRRMGEIFEIHPMTLEDMLDTDQRPRFEQGDDCDAIIMKMLQYRNPDKVIIAEQFTLILGKNYVITLQEKKGDVFNPVRERIRSTVKRTRFTDSEFLAYSLMDTIVENYMLITETLGSQVEAMEERLFDGPDPGLVEENHRLRTELSFLRKTVRPVREVMGQLLISESDMYDDKYRHYFTDLNDLVVQVTEAIELYSSMLTDHLNIYSTHISNRTNEVTKVLTIFASIFIPLTFLTGIYGMNFHFMPELAFKYSYPIFWCVALMIGIGLLIYFKRKDWL
jgi:magnesium transporter